jgi:hypothetical protein
VITPALLRGRDDYERVMDGWVDTTHADAFTHTVVLTDDDQSHRALRRGRAVAELSDSRGALPADRRLARPSGRGERREARGNADGRRLEPAHHRADGDRPWRRLRAGAVVEVARLARQVARLPAERAARAADGNAWECWQLDMTGWIDLPNSCFTYTDAGRRLFGTRTITTPMQPQLYSSAPWPARVFARKKVARLARRDGRLTLFHSMHDNVHGFEITYEIDLSTGTIVRAEHVTPRLPYMGICSEPQRKISALLGEARTTGSAAVSRATSAARPAARSSTT